MAAAPARTAPHNDWLRPRWSAPPRRPPRPGAPPRPHRRSGREAAGRAPVDGAAVDIADRTEIALVQAAAVEVAVNVPAALVALAALELDQVAAPGGAAVVQRAPVAVERLGDDRCVMVVGIGKADDGEEDEDGHEEEVTGGAGGAGHRWKESHEVGEHLTRK